ncbi:amidohydrolase family protein [Steroidobacter agaridevorans]|uniref:amidohydrolase family protein n=1 Tax=Steroidobacter agaridevorans TaxID=2695856 RepID=UPI00132C5D3E|nr:amidohydrolase family protein [Steroidobacter agaridevorans]GFE88458.1 amidohydrolase [Steroidobacter agaridevorans]
MSPNNVALLAIFLSVLCCLPARAQAPQQPPITAFVAVNVLPMDSDRVLPGQTVLVENGKIVAIGASVDVPKDAQIIDGQGSRFLSPGLADMHTHADTAADLALYLANGVTTVLHMGEASSAFMGQIRPAVDGGKIPGPQVYAAFVVDGSPRYGHFVITTPDEARWIVRLAKTNGYDFIKVYNDLSAECFEALIEEGRRQQIAVAGHGVSQVGLERQLAAGQVLVAHTEEFLYAMFSSSNDRPPSPEQIPGVIASIKRYGAFVTADLNTYATIARQWGRPAVVATFMQAPEIRHLSPQRRIEWTSAGYAKRSGDLTDRLSFLSRFTKDMSNAGVPLVVGTDAPTIPGLIPGYSVHENLYALEHAGLTRYEVLAAATRVPGEFIRRSVRSAAPFGTIAPGSRADLIYSAKNPLEDLSTLREPLGVMAKGKWYAQSDLRTLLDEVARKYR